MPTRSSPPSLRAHSCSLVYLRSSFTSLALDIGFLCDSSSVAFVKRGLHDHGFDRFTSAVDREFRARRAHADRQIAEADALLERRGGPARGAHADRVAGGVEQRVAVARDAAAEHLEADERAREPALLDRDERALADEVRLV